jgi:sulfur-oxidizing protein SoxX
MTSKLKHTAAWCATAVVAIAAGCATAPAPVDYDQVALAMMKNSFRAQGQATLDRLDQSPLQKACSSPTPPAPEVAAQIQAREAASIKPPTDGRYLGDWKAGEKLAQNGRGMTWSDPAGAPNGGNCYNCHQMSKAEIAFGTLGPSLYHYGKLRGVTDPNAPAAAAVVQYTWGKLYDAKASNACSGMPRFGHEKLLDDKQMQDLMALLLDPKSPVNQ